MKKTVWFLIVTCAFAGRFVLAGDLTVEGNLNVTSNFTAGAVFATNATVEALAVNSNVTIAGVILGNGGGITNVSGYALVNGTIGTNKVVTTEWEIWGDRRYMNITNSSNLVMFPGRTVAGHGENLSNISVNAYGAMQRGFNSGNQKICSCSFGSSQHVYNNNIISIGVGAMGAEQRGYNSGTQTIGNVSRGATQYGYNKGVLVIGTSADGAAQRGYLSTTSGATNNGVGSIQLMNLEAGQSALITGHASVGLGACQVTNDQAIVAGDSLVSHGDGTVTAFGFYGNGAGITNLDLSAYVGNNLAWDPVSNKLSAVGGVDSNGVLAVLSTVSGLSDGDDDSHWSGTAAGLDAVAGRTALGLGSAATHEAAAFAPADLSGYASDTVTYSDGHFHAAAQSVSVNVTNAVVAAWPQIDTDGTDDLKTSGGALSGDLNMNSNRVMNLPAPQSDNDAIAKAYLRAVLSSLQPQGDLSMGSFTNGTPAAFPLTFE